MFEHSFAYFLKLVLDSQSLSTEEVHQPQKDFHNAGKGWKGTVIYCGIIGTDTQMLCDVLQGGKNNVRKLTGTVSL